MYSFVQNSRIACRIGLLLSIESGGGGLVISETNDAIFSINDQDEALDILMGSLSTGDILISVAEPEGGKLHTASPTIAQKSTK